MKPFRAAVIQSAPVLFNKKATLEKADALMVSAANRITIALDDEDNLDMESLAGDMTAFFLLAVHQQGLDVAQASRFCRLAWRDQAEEHLSIARY